MVQCQVLCRLLDKKHSENRRFSRGPAYCSLRSYMPMVTVLNKSEAEFPRKQMEKHRGEEDQKKDETCKADKGDSTYP